MGNTKVKIEVYKEGGKWYTDLEYESKLPTYETPELIEEAKQKLGKLSDMNFTIEASSDEGKNINRRLVITNQNG